MENDEIIIIAIGISVLVNLILFFLLWRFIIQKFDHLHERISDFRVRQINREKSLNQLRRAGDKPID